MGSNIINWEKSNSVPLGGDWFTRTGGLVLEMLLFKRCIPVNKIRRIVAVPLFAKNYSGVWLTLKLVDSSGVAIVKTSEWKNNVMTITVPSNITSGSYCVAISHSSRGSV